MGTDYQIFQALINRKIFSFYTRYYRRVAMVNALSRKHDEVQIGSIGNRIRRYHRLPYSQAHLPKGAYLEVGEPFREAWLANRARLLYKQMMKPFRRYRGW